MEWEAIPEIGDYTIKNKRPRFESFTPVPDTLLAAAAAEKQTNTAAEPSAGLETPAGYATTDLTAVGEGRETVRCVLTFLCCSTHACPLWSCLSVT